MRSGDIEILKAAAGGRRVKAGSLCTGYGGLDMAAQAIWGPLDLRWVADNDPHVEKVLDARYPYVPNLGDFSTAQDVEPVEVVTAGENVTKSRGKGGWDEVPGRSRPWNRPSSSPRPDHRGGR